MHPLKRKVVSMNYQNDFQKGLLKGKKKQKAKQHI